MELTDAVNAAAKAVGGENASLDTITADTNIIEAVQAHPEILQVFADYGSGLCRLHGFSI